MSVKAYNFIHKSS